VLFFALLLITGASSLLAYLAWRKPYKLTSGLEKLLSKTIWARGIFLISALIFLAGLWINLEPSQLPILPERFLRIQPVLLWVTFQAALTIFCLASLFPQVRYILGELFVFTISLLILHSVQLFLFPLEKYWITIATGLFIYMLVEAQLVQSG
jgi:hypothetical protein